MPSVRWLLLVLVVAALPAAAQPPLPPLLEPWRDWVRHERPWLACAPRLGGDHGNADARLCAWPGVLHIAVEPEGARFRQRWILQSRGLVPLPGDARHRPVDVQRDGRPVEVLLIQGRPMLQLEAGEHRLSGRWRWQRRPETLPVPEEAGLLQLRLDGREIDLVERRDGRLWLGRGEARTEGDGLALRLFRLLEDGVPLRLHSELQIDVAGRAREQVLGRVLPAGFVPVALDSSLPASIDSDGQLRVQLRPGSWRLRLQARAASAEVREFGPETQPLPWPQEEIWSIRPNAELRVIQPEGQRPVDPDQVGAPWGEALPSFALAAGERLQLVEVARGRDPQRPHRLHLQRELWLDFNGEGFTARDRLSGELAAVGRLDLQAPWVLRRAEGNGEDLLITAGDAGGRSGVELRSLDVRLDAIVRHDAARAVSATGWLQDFESARLQLHLPPGWRLLAAVGADRAPGAWVERWRLLDLFGLAVLVLLAHRLGRWPLALPTGGLLLLAYHEPRLPLGWLAASLLLALLVGLFGAGRLRAAGRWLQRLALAGLLVFALPFFGSQLQWAFFPQLEREAVGEAGHSSRYSDADNVAGLAMMQQDSAAPMAPAEAEERVLHDRIVVSGSQIKRADTNLVQAQRSLEKYPKDAVVQAGLGLPDWSWQRQAISWDGPVTAAQSLDLWLTPPWLTGLWRLLQCLLLAMVLFGLLRSAGWGGGRWPARLAAGGVLLLAAPLQASSFPPADLLDDLGERLSAAPPCGNHCAALARVELRLDGQRLHLALDWHAAADTAVPLPRSGSRWQPDRVAIAGDEATVRWQDGQRWLPLSRGVNRVEMSGPLAGLDALDLQFSAPPAELQIAAPGWDVAGLVEGRLQGDSLQLSRRAEAGASSVGGGNEFPAFVAVTRQLSLDLEWTLVTTVRRIAPQQAGFSIGIPLLAGEQPLKEDLALRDGMVLLSFAAGEQEQRWQSRLAVSNAIDLEAGLLGHASERWELAVGPYWSVGLTGLPELNSPFRDGVRRFQPLPGETLHLEVRRPEALRGGSVAIDRASADWRLGQRSQAVDLQFRARATRGGQHVLRLPEGAELVAVTLRGEAQNLRLQDARLSLPLLPGDNAVAVQFRLNRPLAMRQRAEGIDLGADAANLTTRVYPGDSRWLLAAGSEGVGPVVLYWPQLLLLAIAAWLLARHAPTPLRWSHWLLLGLGFSTVSWWAALVVASWLLALGWRARQPPSSERRWRFIGVQLGLLAITALALLCLLAAIPYGLLGDPDMQVGGNGSSAGRLIGFLDRSSGALPAVWLLSLPLWLYQAAILLWSLWLANALLGWLRWGAEAFRHGGSWPPRRPPVAAVEAAPEGSVG